MSPAGAALLSHIATLAVLATARPESPPRLTGFVTAPRKGTAVVSSPDGDSIRVSWRGTCLARIDESLPSPAGVPPPACLHDAEVSEERLPDLNDERADYLFGDAAALRQWRSCRKLTAAETCLDRLLPLTGGGSGRARGLAGWIKVRDQARKGTGVRRATCRLARVDEGDGTVEFRCRGTLIDAACSGRGSVTFGSGPGGCAGGQLNREPSKGSRTLPRCSAASRARRLPTRQMTVVGHVDDAPAEACLRRARAALRVSPDRFAAARAAAFAACAPGASIHDDQSLAPGPRALVHRVLARQEALFGAVALPGRCTPQDSACVAVHDGGDLARVVARGCDNQVWAVQSTGNVGTIGNGRWGGYTDDRKLVRLPSAAKVREPEESSPYIVDTLAWGDVFRGYQMDHGRADEAHTEADLISEACVARQGGPDLCTAYAGGQPVPRSTIPPSGDDWKRIAALIALDWPRASRRLARWQRELASGARLNERDGEEQRQTCARLLIDACTGDLGEVCTLREVEDDASCEGELLPDGRCRQHHFARLPLLPARPPARR